MKETTSVEGFADGDIPEHMASGKPYYVDGATQPGKMEAVLHYCESMWPYLTDILSDKPRALVQEISRIHKSHATMFLASLLSSVCFCLWTGTEVNVFGESEESPAIDVKPILWSIILAVSR